MMNKASILLVMVTAFFGTSFSPQTSQPTTGYINGHKYVDLGLSCKWATANIGASTPSGYGNYYAWGETKIKTSYTTDNSITYGKAIGDIAGNPEYDAANANWGGAWRLPSIKEMDELINKCDWQWTTNDGRNGYKITGPNGNNIFLPVSSLKPIGEYGYYWSSSPYEGVGSSFCLGFSKRDFHITTSFRYEGYSVRPVLEKGVSIFTESPYQEYSSHNGHEYVDLGLSVKWATCNVGAEKPSEYGDHYAWGEPRFKSSYTMDNSITFDKIIGIVAGNPQYDVATAEWGTPWRLPTDKEIRELINKCKWQWATIEGKNGYTVTGINGESIFLPVAGFREGISLYYDGEYGFYWSGNPYQEYINDPITGWPRSKHSTNCVENSFGFYFFAGGIGITFDARYFGLSIRPVSD